jgi:hypothetical protein
MKNFIGGNQGWTGRSITRAGHDIYAATDFVACGRDRESILLRKVFGWDEMRGKFTLKSR